jgi:succinate dehydrogenase/fumarate reductase flavoprotein subunit
MAQATRTPDAWTTSPTVPIADPVPEGVPIKALMSESDMRDLMWRQAAVFREGNGLASAGAQLDAVVADLDRQRQAGAALSVTTWRDVSLATVAALIVRAALDRCESRGAHSRTDFPAKDDLHWKRRRYENRAHP